eukprot:TRINITY_DN7612_c0_g3_i1.p1 TRINITY_DN7612_c0_g3~~TRINITY_DN7612_c0_g3_i1.p1  ORF type:complete len:105 (+),score=5.42 TRINITY_DN7612_c0_g3_i1:501-815(+)
MSLSNVTSIGDGFLYGSSLSSFQLSLSNVTAIGDCFLAACWQLTSLNLTSLNNVAVIGVFFFIKRRKNKCFITPRSSSLHRMFFLFRSCAWLFSHHLALLAAGV